MKFKIQGKELSILDLTQPNSGSLNDYLIDVETDETWQNLTKVAKICIDKEEQGIERAVIDDKVYIDMQKYQRYTIGFIGYTLSYFLTQDTEIVSNKTYYTRSGEEGQYVYEIVENPNVEQINTYYEAKKDYQRSTNLVVLSYKKGAGEIEILEEEIPTPTEWEIYIEQIQDFINNANEIIDEANTLDVDSNGEILTITKKDGTTKAVNVKGDTGEQGPIGPEGHRGIQGETGNGISSIIKTSTSGLVDTYTITYTNGTTTTFDITNGEDGEVTEAQLDEVKEECELLRNDINEIAIDISGTGENVALNNTSGARFKKFQVQGNSKQATRSGKNLINVTKEWNLTGRQYVSVTLPAGNYILTTGEVTKGGTTNPACVGLTSSYFSLTSNLVKNITLTEAKTRIEFYSNGYDYNASRGVTSVVNNLMIRSADIQDDTYEEFGISPSPEYPSEIKCVTGNVNIKVSDSSDLQNQNFIFPLGLDKLMLGDYLADDGIHHLRKQITFDGTENWQIYSINPETKKQHYLAISDLKHIVGEATVLSNSFKPDIIANRNVKDNISYSYADGIAIRCDTYQATTEWKAFLSQKYAGETPVIGEYELKEPIIIPYTSEQQAVYDEIKKTIHSYKGGTHISSTNETSPIFNVTAMMDLNNLLIRIEALENQ